MKRPYKLFSMLIKWGLYGGLACGLALFALLYLLARGVPGWLLSGCWSSYIPPSVGTLTIDRVAFSFAHGLQLKEVALISPDQVKLVGCGRLAIGVAPFAQGDWINCVTSVTLDKPYVRQIDYSHPAPRSKTGWDREAMKQLINLPTLRPIPLVVTEIDVLDVRMQEAQGTLSIRDGHIVSVTDITGIVATHPTGTKEVAASPYVTADLHEGILKTRIHGVVYPSLAHGVYRAIDFPIIEHYSSLFTLSHPANVDTTFSVGLHPSLQHFHFVATLATDHPGSYLGVPFDALSGQITVDGVNHAVTRIAPVKIYRNGKLALALSLIFDLEKQAFTFDAKNKGLAFDELLTLVDEDFTDAIPKLTSAQPPKATLKGGFPLLLDAQDNLLISLGHPLTPKDVWLQGDVQITSPASLYEIPFERASASVVMRDAVLKIEDLSLTTAASGRVLGGLSITIPDVPSPEFVDLSLQAQLKSVPCKIFSAPLKDGRNALQDMLVSGEVALSAHMDEQPLASLAGDVDLEFLGGIINRLRLFGGLTDAFATYIPGVRSIADTSRAVVDVSADKGLLTISEMRLSGDLFALEGKGTFDLVKDDVKLDVVVAGFKKESFLGDITRWASLPVSRFLSEFEVYGSLRNAKWHRKSTTSKITQGVKSLSKGFLSLIEASEKQIKRPWQKKDEPKQ